MSNLIIKKTPGAVVLAGNQNVFKVVAPLKYSNAIFAPGWKQLEITIGHVAENKITITNSFGSVTFTCKNAPDASGLQYKSFTSGTLNEWVLVLMDYLRKNVFINRHYALNINTGNAIHYIVFNARELGYDTCPTLSNVPSGTSFGVFQGYNPAEILPTGYKILMMHERAVDNPYSGNPILAQDGPFDCASRTSTRDEILEDAATYARGAIVEKDVSFLMQTKCTGHYTFPEPTGAWHVEHDVLQRHKFFFYDQSGIPAVTGSGIETDTIYSLAGTMSELRQAQMHAEHGTFEQWLNSTKSFLSFSPNVKKIDPYSVEKLYYLSQAAQTLVLNITRFFADGTNDIITSNVDMTMGKVYELCVSYKKVKVGAAKKIIKYDVTLMSGYIPIQIKTFVMDYSFNPFARYFLFRNSLGVYESMRTTGSITKLVEVTKETSKKELPANFGVGDVSEKVDRVTGSTSYQVNSGFLTQEEAEYFQEFMGSDDILWFKMGAIYPVVVKEFKAALYKDNVFINNIGFTLTHSQSDNFENNFDNLPRPEGGDFNEDWNGDFN